MGHSIPRAAELDYGAGLVCPQAYRIEPARSPQGRSLAVPVEQQPVLEERLQDTGKQMRAVFPDIEEKTGKRKGFALPQDTINRRIDIFTLVDLLVEPSFHRHQHAMNGQAERNRPIMMPAKNVRIAAPEAGFVIYADIKTVALGEAPGREIDKPQRKRQSLIGGILEKPKERTATVQG